MLRGNRLSDDWYRRDSAASASPSFAPSLAPSDAGLATLPRVQRLDFARRHRSTSDPTEHGGGGSVGLFRRRASSVDIDVTDLNHILPLALARTRSKESTSSIVGGLRVMLHTILEGRTCSPAGLKELRDFARLVDAEATGAGRPTHMTAALEFAIAFHEYEGQFYHLSPDQRAMSPTPFEIISELRRMPIARRQPQSASFSLSNFPAPPVPKPLPPTPTRSSQLSPRFPTSPRTPQDVQLFFTLINTPDDTGELFLQPDVIAKRALRRQSVMSGLPTSVNGDTSDTGSVHLDNEKLEVNPFDVAESEALSRASRVSFAPSSIPERPRPAMGRYGIASTVYSSFYSGGGSVATILPEGLAPKEQPLRPALARLRELFLVPDAPKHLCRLVPEQLLLQAVLESQYTTHPKVLEPVNECVVDFLEEHLVRSFLQVSSQNLSASTAWGRLFVAVVALAIATTLTVLLILAPSPLTGRTAVVPRPFRLVALPFLAVAVGYAIAAKTRVCLWLVWRGVREETALEVAGAMLSSSSSRAAKFARLLGFASRTRAIKDSLVKSQQRRLTVVITAVFVLATAGLQVAIVFLPNIGQLAPVVSDQ